MDRALSVGVEVKDGSVTLSSDNDFAAVVYVRSNDDARFLIPDFERELALLRSLAFERLSNSNHDPRPDKHLMQHIHFPQSIKGVRVVHGVLYNSSSRCTVTIDIAKCSGCCTHEERPTYDLVETPHIPGVMWNCLRGKLPQTRDLSENRRAIPLSLMESELWPGDYGHFPQDGDQFKVEGNIESATVVGLDPIQDVIRDHLTSSHFALDEAASWSLPANQQVVSLLKTLSSRLSGRLLITRVIRRSDRCCSPRLYCTFTPDGAFDIAASQILHTPTPLCSVMMPLT
ncbi:hypothetical protein EDC04DRAFT_3139931, partial [Pisolithus marmoratus]